jgi:hypothetical protein
MNMKTKGFLQSLTPGATAIRSPYVKRDGVPAPGQRVFIRTRQLINGWEDEPKETNALVPRLWQPGCVAGVIVLLKRRARLSEHADGV